MVSFNKKKKSDENARQTCGGIIICWKDADSSKKRKTNWKWTILTQRLRMLLI